MASSETQEMGAKEQAQQKAEEVKARASDRVRGQVDTRSTEMAEQIEPLAQALHKAGDHLESRGSPRAARRRTAPATRWSSLRATSAAPVRIACSATSKASPVSGPEPRAGSASSRASWPPGS